MSSALFDQLVVASGISPLVAPFTVRRLLMRADVVPPEAVTPEQLAVALPNFREGLAVYLADAELQEALERIDRLAGEPAGT